MNHYKTRRRRTDDEKRDLIRQVDERIKKGASAKAACKEVGIYDTQWRDWRTKLEGQPNGDAREVKHRSPDNEKVLRIENQRLKMIVAEQALDIQALKEWRAR
jgi:transposase-like protein